MSYIGKIGAARLDPENLLDFSVAEQMAKEGFDPTVIKIRTVCQYRGLCEAEIW